MSETVNHPRHYNTHPAGIECIVPARLMGFNTGNVLKYVWRSGLKGPALVDLKKALWYLEDEIARLERMGRWERFLFRVSRWFYMPDCPHPITDITKGFHPVIAAGMIGLLTAEFMTVTVEQRLQGLRVALDLIGMYTDVMENEANHG